MSDETIYMGNTQNEDMNESEHKSVIANVWKPITIGGFTGILLGAGALLASNASAANQDPEDASQDDVVGANDKTVEDLVGQMSAQNELEIANIEPGLTFEEAFADARAQVGPGGIFYWHGAIFSTYTEDEWNAMTEDEQARFALQVQPEVDADHVDANQIAAVDTDQIADVASQEVEDTPPTAMPVDDMADDMEMAMADVAPQEMVDDVDLELEMEVDEDVQIADFQPDRVIEDLDLALADVSAKSMESMDNEAQPQNIVHEFDADDDVRIVGYGEYDGHIVTGLDLDGDNQADIAVIDVDDSGNYSRPDIVIDSEGNMSTYGELEDFALEQMPGEDNDQLNEAQAQNPEVAQDMPDYMDDALAQV